jgi:DNA-binding MarR family transcriptional regulator
VAKKKTNTGRGKGTALWRSGLDDRPIMRGYLPHYLSRLMNLLNLRLLEYLRPLNMTTQQFRVMQVLLARGVASVGEISRDAVIEQSVVSRVLDQLEQRGFAQRQKRAGNARVVEVSLTPVGEAVYNSITPYSMIIVNDAVSVLDDQEKAHLEELLSRIFHHVRQPHAVASGAKQGQPADGARPAPKRRRVASTGR